MLKGKLIVVTGGAGLLGREFVKTIVQNDGIAVIADINSKLGTKLKLQLSEELKSHKIEFVQLDTTSKMSLKNCIDYLNNKYVTDTLEFTITVINPHSTFIYQIISA